MPRLWAATLVVLVICLLASMVITIVKLADADAACGSAPGVVSARKYRARGGEVMFDRIVVGTDGSRDRHGSSKEGHRVARSSRRGSSDRRAPTSPCRSSACATIGDSGRSSTCLDAQSPQGRRSFILGELHRLRRRRRRRSRSRHPREAIRDAILDVAEETTPTWSWSENEGMTGARRFLLGSVPTRSPTTRPATSRSSRRPRAPHQGDQGPRIPRAVPDDVEIAGGARRRRLRLPRRRCLMEYRAAPDAEIVDLADAPDQPRATRGRGRR